MKYVHKLNKYNSISMYSSLNYVQYAQPQLNMHIECESNVTLRNTDVSFCNECLNFI
jgi:hypothetical protein